MTASDVHSAAPAVHTHARGVAAQRAWSPARRARRPRGRRMVWTLALLANLAALIGVLAGCGDHGPARSGTAGQARRDGRRVGRRRSAWKRQPRADSVDDGAGIARRGAPVVIYHTRRTAGPRVEAGVASSRWLVVRTITTGRMKIRKPTVPIPQLGSQPVVGAATSSFAHGGNSTMTTNAVAAAARKTPRNRTTTRG
jgi:hypothetical protein